MLHLVSYMHFIIIGFIICRLWRKIKAVTNLWNVLDNVQHIAAYAGRGFAGVIRQMYSQVEFAGHHPANVFLSWEFAGCHLANMWEFARRHLANAFFSWEFAGCHLANMWGFARCHLANVFFSWEFAGCHPTTISVDDNENLVIISMFTGTNVLFS